MGSEQTQPYIDTAEFSRLGLDIGGEVSLVSFARFCEGLPEQLESQVIWSLKGRRNAGGQSFLEVSLVAQPVLQCQRCLEPFVFKVETRNQVELVSRESDLEDDDENEDAIERIVGARRFDVMSFIEDELILAVPYVPRHEVCPTEQPFVQVEAPDEQETRPSPFAVLGQLKQDR